MFILALEPSLAWKLIFHYKSYSLALELVNQAKNIPVVLPCSPIKIWGKSVKRFLCYYQLNKQTNKDYYFI